MGHVCMCVFNEKKSTLEITEKDSIPSNSIDSLLTSHKLADPWFLCLRLRVCKIEIIISAPYKLKFPEK